MKDREQKNHPLISIIIPHRNGKHHLVSCLGSLRRQVYPTFEIILADNGSDDGTQSYVRQNYPEVRLLELGENRGFTGACNAGYSVSQGEIVILLNNDTETDPHWLDVLADTFARHPEVGIVASKMLLFDRRDTFHTAGDFYSVGGIPGNRGVWQQDTGQYDLEEPVFSACGGAAAYRRRMIEQIGFLDDDFFFSCEDIDLAWRAHLHGWKVLYEPRAVVYHKLKASAGTGAISSYYDGRNFLYVIWKNYPTSLLKQNWKAILKTQFLISREALRSWRGAAARARLRGQVAGLLGVLKMWSKRRQIQEKRQTDDETIMSLLTPVDETPQQR